MLVVFYCVTGVEHGSLVLTAACLQWGPSIIRHTSSYPTIHTVIVRRKSRCKSSGIPKTCENKAYIKNHDALRSKMLLEFGEICLLKGALPFLCVACL